MNRLIIAGSPRAHGRSSQLAEALFEACIEDCPHDGVSLVSVASLDIRPCTGCNACRELAVAAASQADGLRGGEGDNARPGGEGNVDGEGVAPRRCIQDDDMAEVYAALDGADEVSVVSPVYFAGAPAQMKCLIDRLQPYFWTNARTKAKRPAVLHVVGEGGDPHGYSPLVGTVRSSFSCAGFELERVLDWVGKIREDGEITADAEEYPASAFPPVLPDVVVPVQADHA